MKITSAEFKVSAPNLRACPNWAWPEFAFIGRSNVGKSSLINLLSGRRELAKVSGTPGKTQLLNFFLINHAWSLVDLPGYGYAKTSRDRRADFSETVAEFLTGRANLRCVFVLLDSRLTPQAIDLDFLRWLEGKQVSYALVFTKTDKQSASRSRTNLEAFGQALRSWRSELPPIFTSSAETGAGRAEILAAIAAAIAD